MIDLTGGSFDSTAWYGAMTTQPMGPHSGAQPSHWYSSTCNKSYVLALLRAGVVALVLLGILAVIVLF
ncbi:Uncharacterised protein [Mycolicibacterium chitae]|uniref:Uncharacterized protein n=2 Tax=Mycolicibacterium chitae TaxID=1792 RepID=A0A3S4SVH6_MYCCI|nr:Uncharacterised protein [Mycolicibacterium chitae]